MAESGEENHGVKYLYKKEILYRSTLDTNGSETCKVVVPVKIRSIVLSFGHDNPMAGHLGRKKTTGRIKSEYWWPGLDDDIKHHCLSVTLVNALRQGVEQRTLPSARCRTLILSSRELQLTLLGR